MRPVVTSFTNSALVMLAIGDDVARGIGLVGALTVIRFRSTLKDTRDLMFAFATLAIGVACGVLAFAVAILGAAVFCVAMLYLCFSDYGMRRMFNAVLKIQVPPQENEQKAVAGVLGKYTINYVLIHSRDLGGGTQEHSYHLRLRDAAQKGLIVKTLGEIPGVVNASLLMQDTSLEP